jgi:hypothetical protein
MIFLLLFKGLLVFDLIIVELDKASLFYAETSLSMSKIAP